MTIGIIGGGATGLLFSWYLSRQNPLKIFVRTNNQAEKINDNGITLYKAKEPWTSKSMTASSSYEGLEDCGVILIMVKQYHLSGILPILSKLPKEIPLVFLQNGLGHLDDVNELPNENILLGTIEHGCQRIDSDSVRHNGTGLTRIAPLKGDVVRLKSILKDYDEDFPISFGDSWKQILYKKLIVNAAINPLTAVLNVPNGSLVDNPYFKKLLHSILEEIIPLFPEVDEKEMMQNVVGICESTKENRSSMLKDIEAGRKTEIDAIMGYCLKQGELLGHQMAFSRLIYEMVKGKEVEQGG
ncbi:2-dehydropantoate 2-reductase [Falsibacillus pallidus]|uniref:2-dehydropantoate 2-reductase n=1 Tax=Falsibacillus pallidus TaxID=493781 RepID=A0A370GVK5_9BACI|nr:2-dehydropantoate 2-reductase [Falsibacillus pallidus]RDI47561.1 ketopantoate reductase [Falsibacillus pallidus]